MKKVLLFTIISIGLYSIANSQINKGSVLLGGGININNTKYDDNSSSTAPGIKDNYLSVNPAVGIAIKENLVMGVKLIYGHSENIYHPSSSSQVSINEYTSYGGGVFLRKYLHLGKGFYFFGDGSLDYTRNKQELSYTGISAPSFQNTSGKGWNIGLGFNPGISYALNKKFHLEAGLPNLLSLNYGKNKQRTFSSTTVEKTSFGLSSNASNLSSFSIGFRFLFAK